MAITVANGITFMRQLLEDTDATLQGATDDELVVFINERYTWWWKSMEKRSTESVLIALAQSAFVTNSTLTTAEEVLSVHRVVSGSQTSSMERMEWNELRNLQNYDSTEGTPIRYAVRKSAADQTWVVATHPVPDGAYTLNAVHTSSPATMTSSDTPILGNAECYSVYRLAAYDYAYFIGRPDKADVILQPLPDQVKAKLGLEQKRQDPKRRDIEARI